MGNNSIGYYSRQSADYRKIGRDADAERSEHYMRCEIADKIGTDAAKDYKEQSRRYYEAKAAGREETAATYKHFMDVALLKMMGDN